MNTDEIINEGYGEGRKPRMDVMYTFSGKSSCIEIPLSINVENSSDMKKNRKELLA